MVKKSSYKRGEVIDLLILATLPVILTVIIGAIISILCGTIINDIKVIDLVVIWGSMIFAMCVVPVLYLKKNNQEFSIKELEFRKISKKDIVLSIAISVWFVIGCYEIENVQFYDLFQNLPISFAEEFWCKGILFYQLKKIFPHKAAVIILSAVIFSFVTHMNGDLWANLLIRMPVGIITGIIYEKDKSLVLPISIHFIYNVLIA